MYSNPNYKSKNEIREIQKKKRNQYTNEMICLLNKQIRRLFNVLFDYLESDKLSILNKEFRMGSSRKINIFIYLSSFEKGEVDTWELINKFLQKQDIYSVYVPKIKGNSIVPVKYSNHFTKNNFGILECEGEPDPTIIPDIIITPLLAFDSYGNRIGYGAGYYDRYLNSVKETNKSFLAIGLSFENDTKEKWNIEEHDVSLDYVVCSTKVYQCTSQ